MSDNPDLSPAYIDSVTGLSNRLYFESCLKEEVRRSRRDGGTFCLALFDLDYFKLCNDTLGTRWGDQVLRRVAEVLSPKIRPPQIFSRYEGDEFTLLMPGMGLEKAQTWVRELLRSLSRARYPGQELFQELFPSGKLTASVGLSAYDPSIQRELDLMSWADYALFRAKREGRDKLVVQAGPPYRSEQAQNPLSLFQKLSGIFPTHRPFDEKLQDSVETIKNWMGVDVCSLYLLEGKELVLHASDGLDPASIGKVRMRTNEGLTGLVIETLTLVCAREADKHPRYKFFPETGEKAFGSYLGVPILFEHHPLAVLVVQTRLHQDFTEEEIKVLQTIAGFLGTFFQPRKEAE